MALETFLQRTSTDKLFDLLPDGRIVGWEIRGNVRVLRDKPNDGQV